MVLYFTGTGNSRYVAERIAQALGDTLCSLNDRIKAGDTSPVNSDARLIIVVPTYAWRIPHIVREHLENTAVPGAAQVWFVMTCGGQIGGAGRHNQALAQRMGLAYQGTAQIVMPENYIALFQAPQAEERGRSSPRPSRRSTGPLSPSPSPRRLAPPRSICSTVF